jgi:hypothetical protein
MPVNFDWKRFWCPRGEAIRLADQGFLSDPNTEWGKALNPSLIPFDQLADIPCLALLGEPGIGKSWAIRHDIASGEAPAENEISIHLDLRSFGSEDRLVSRLFESAEWETWRSGGQRLSLFLDSLDECLLRIDNVASLLADELAKQPADRLRLRIACRTVPWPAILEEALIKLYGDEGFKAYELAPLRRVDVKHAADRSGIADGDSFLARIDALEAAPLGIKPVTLKFLIGTYLREGDFPPDQLDLYEKGCRALCEESNESRLGSDRKGRLSPDERVVVASRIAGVTQFANRYAVWIGREAEAAFSEDVLVRDLCGGVEIGIDGVAVTPEAIREVLDTGLFSSRGPERIGWAHQTYAEFLAARYCRIHAMPVQQLRALLFHPADQGQRLVPQVYELAAWISATNPQILDLVASSDPEALLGAAGASLSNGQRNLVVESILKQCEAGRRLDLRWDMYRLYSKLKHPSLATQLRGYLRRGTQLETRRVAVRIAQACEVRELAVDLVDVALDTSEDKAVRIRAVLGTEKGPAEVRARLRPLAFGGEDDRDDELKGSALSVLWPDLITPMEIFAFLTAPKAPNLSGIYTRFLHSRFLERTDLSALPAALEWVSKQPSRQITHGAIDYLVGEILRLAWDNLGQEGVIEAFASAAVSRLRLHESVFGSRENKELAQKVATDRDRRRAILAEIIPRLTIRDASALRMQDPEFVVSADLEWLVQRVISQESPSAPQIEPTLVRLCVNADNREQMRTLWYACQSNRQMNSECGGFFAAIPLDSGLARTLRESLRLQKELEPKPLVPPPSERIERDLVLIEGGDVARWIELTLDLALEPTSRAHDRDLHSDLTVLPGWRSSAADVRGRIIDAAFRYVQEAEPNRENWFCTPSIPYVAIKGLSALVLLLLAAEDKILNLSPDVWRKWVPILLKFPQHGTDDLRVQSRLLIMAYSRVPEEVVDRVIQLIEIENERDGFFFLASEIDCCWDQLMASALLAKSADPALKPQMVAGLLERLLKHKVAGSIELAKSSIVLPPPQPELQRGRMLAAIEALVMNTPDATWRTVWPVITQSDDFGRSVIESVTYTDPGHANFISKLSEPELADLYLWMVRNYPYAEQSGGPGFMSPSDTAVILRDSILEHLRRRGTWASCEAIRRVAGELPQYTWLRHYVEQAELLARAASWEPISARNFLALALDRKKRFVENSRRLVEVILESLTNLNETFHGELPTAKDLWNSRNGEFWPKDEQDLSDYLARYLDKDLRARGVIVNREVQIRRGTGRGSGQSTDIHVDASVPGAAPLSYERTYVIVEAKGIWHPELLTAMKTQLRDRYLNQNACKDGIYLAGWFACPQWTEGDSRRGPCTNLSLQSLKEILGRQAEELSVDGYILSSFVLDISLD